MHLLKDRMLVCGDGDSDAEIGGVLGPCPTPCPPERSGAFAGSPMIVIVTISLSPHR